MIIDNPSMHIFMKSNYIIIAILPYLNRQDVIVRYDVPLCLLFEMV